MSLRRIPYYLDPPHTLEAAPDAHSRPVGRRRRIPHVRGPHHDVTFRAIALGALLALAINLACPYSVLMLQNAGLTSDYITAGAMILFLVLAGLINPVLKRLRTAGG